MISAIHNRAIFTAVTLMFCFILLAAFGDFRSSRASGSVESGGIAASGSVTQSATDDSAQSPEQAMTQMRNEMAALKQEMSRAGHTPELLARYKSLSDQMFAASANPNTRDTGGTFQISAPEVNVCTAGTLGASNHTFQRPNPTGPPFTCPGTTPTVRFQNFGFNLTSCTTFPTNVTISMCGAAPCAGVTGQNMDTIIYVYRTGGATGAGGAANPFNKSAPCTNLVALNDDGTGCGGSPDSLRSALTVSLGSGHFVVVVCAFSDAFQNSGNYNLLVDAPGAACSLTGEPTAVEMESFTASGYGDGTLLEWRTGLEVKNLGFNVYREEGGQRSRLNEQILGGSALRVGSISLRSGSPYAWTDTSPAGKKTRYWLEDVGLDGQSTWHGPFNVDRARS